MKYGFAGLPAAGAGLAAGWTSTGLSVVTSVSAALATALPVATSKASCARAVENSSPAEIASAHNPATKPRLFLLFGLYSIVPSLTLSEAQAPLDDLRPA